MKTEYRIWAKPTPHATYKPGELYPDLDAAKDATGLPVSVPWGTNGDGPETYAWDEGIAP